MSRSIVVLAAASAAVAPIGFADAADPAPSAGRLAAVPADFVALTDDTGALTMSVPSSWTDVDTAPGTNDDGTVMPWISASTDFSAYLETFDVPGVLFIGVTYTTDLQSWIDRLGQPTSACPTSSSAPYDDGKFAGLATTFEQCGPTGQASLLVLAANDANDTTRTYVVQIQAPTAADVALFDPILASFNTTGAPGTSAAPPAATAPPAPSVDASSAPTAITLPDGTPLVPATAPGQEGSAPIADAGPFTPSNSVAEGALQLTDDTRTITLAVPPDWVESATGASPEGLPQILVSPQLAGFAPGGTVGQAFAAPGVRFVARPFNADTAGAVTTAAAALPCTPGTVQAYEDPVFVGHILQLTDCGGTPTRVYLVEANPADSSLTASLVIQVTDIDDSDLQTVLSTFDVAREDAAGPAGPPTTVAGSAPTTGVGPVTTLAAATLPTVPPPTAGPGTLPAVPSLGAVPSSTVAGPTTVAVATGVFSPPVEVPPGTESVSDDTGFLRVGVPAAWTSRDTAPIVDANGVTYPYIAAAADLATFFLPDGDAPDPNGGAGVVYSGVPFETDTTAALAEVAGFQPCTPGPVQQYADAVFTGHIQELSACGGTQTRRYLVVANPTDGAFTAVVLVQVTDDPSVLNTVLSTFDYEPTAAGPG